MFNFYRVPWSGWLTILFLLTFAKPCVSQDDDALRRQLQRGFEGLELISQFVELEAIDDATFAVATPKETVLVVLGSVERVSVVDSFLSEGGAVLVASDQASERTATLKYGVKFIGESVTARSENDGYLSNRDCPVIRRFSEHPSLNGVRSIASNRPGIMLADDLTVIARYPALSSVGASDAFAAAGETKKGGRIIAIADQTIFTNQMITAESNDLFAYQSLLWLKDSDRKYVHFIVDGDYKRHDNVEDLELPPVQLSPDEIREILKQLPAEKLLEFGNQLAADVEDKDLINEFLREQIDGISDYDYNRGMIWALFFGVCVSLILAFLWQKKMLRRTASVAALERHFKSKKLSRFRAIRDRQWAANLLLDSFCRQAEGRGYRDWPSFPEGLSVRPGAESERLFDEMGQASNDFKTKPASYWTQSRLLKLEADVNNWLVMIVMTRGESK
ncbi:MAG: hypothetical protein GY748_17360 [Planctomycetaceae bacterium]|nr:hypothetical protein [Planctomycetaceae bacterium]